MFNLIRYYCVNGLNTPTTLRGVWAKVPRTEEVVEIWKDIYE